MIFVCACRRPRLVRAARAHGRIPCRQPFVAERVAFRSDKRIERVALALERADESAPSSDLLGDVLRMPDRLRLTVAERAETDRRVLIEIERVAATNAR